VITSNTSLQTVSAELIQNYILLERTLYLQCGDCVIHLQSNSAPLLDKLSHYFRHINIAPTAVDMTVIAIDCPEPNLKYPFQNWPREAGKKVGIYAFISLFWASIVGSTNVGLGLFNAVRTCST
jgi:hypothetical protein